MNSYFFQKALEDEQFIKESKDKLKDTIVGGIKTTVITTAGLYNAAVGVYATAIDFLATNFFESEIDILLKKMSVYNNVIDWGGKLIKIDIYMKIIDIQVQVIFMMWREEEQKFHGTTRITKQAMSIHCMVKNTCGER